MGIETYFGILVVGVIGVYVLLRLGCWAIFRSYFEARRMYENEKHVDDGRRDSSKQSKQEVQ